MTDIYAIISEAGAKGISITQIQKKASASGEMLQSELRRLRGKQQIAGPVKSGQSQLYYAKGYEPGGESVSRMIDAAIRDGGEKLATISQIEKQIRQPFRKVFKDGLAVLIGSGKAVRLKGGRSAYLLHVDVVHRLFPILGISAKSAPSKMEDVGHHSSFRDEVLSAYQSLKHEQGGLSAVSIGRLINRLGCAREALHQYLLGEAAEGRADLHPTTVVELDPVDREGALPLPGRNEPAITVTLRG